MKDQIILSSESASKTNIIGTTEHVTTKPLKMMYDSISEVAHFDSGLLPLDGSGILSIRHAGDRTQFVFQHVPGIYYILWGAHEGSNGDGTQVHLAQPYRIVIGDHVNGTIRGARHFYSPVPITSIDQPLYHCNVPNLNCKGYSGTGVGWICIYHTDSSYTSDLPLGAKIHKTVEHASGHEAYNDSNMSETDGPGFYAQHYKHNKEYSYLWNKNDWQKKSEKEGYEWTLNPDLWIPVKVNGIDDQDRHAPKGQPLTLEMAMLGNYAAYYPNKSLDEKPLSLMNRLRRDDQEDPSDKDIYSLFFESFNKVVAPPSLPSVPPLAKKVVSVSKKPSKTPAEVQAIKASVWTPAPPIFNDLHNVLIGHCHYCTTEIYQDDSSFKDTHGNLICDNCKEQHFMTTDCCNVSAHAGDLFFWQAGDEEFVYCYSCHKLSTCENCSENYLDSEYMLYDGVCIGCEPNPVHCSRCGDIHKLDKIYSIEANGPSPEDPALLTVQVFNLCLQCFEGSVICACGLLKDESTTASHGDGHIVCGPCIKFVQDVPIYSPVHIKQEVKL